MEEMQKERLEQGWVQKPAGQDAHEHAHDGTHVEDYPGVDHDHEANTVEHAHQGVDYGNFSKEQFVNLVKELAAHEDPGYADRIARQIHAPYEELFNRERRGALEKFVKEGGSEEDFVYKGDDFDTVFFASIQAIRDRKAEYGRKQEETKHQNLRHRQELIERLRALLDAQDTTDQFNQFKQLQREWKSVGPMPGAHAKTIWASYHALVDRFYDNQSIYFELKELDRKKNLEAKLDLCERAERLLENRSVNEAVKELNELHQEFKHFGPVPIEEKEAVWQRFKAASDQVYNKRDEFVEGLKQELEANLQKKSALCDGAEALLTFDSDRIKEWNAKTREILALQKQWEVIGGLPRNKARVINKRFWSSFKSFFNKKSAFFKKLDDERESNLTKKLELLQLANELKDSAEWEKTADELKRLQMRWREIGPVPEKFREKVFKEFKEACDHFFQRKRTEHGRLDQDQHENLKAKEAIISEMEKHISGGTCTAETLSGLGERFEQIGFVPRKDLNRIRNKFEAMLERFAGATPDLSDEDRGRILLEHQLSIIRSDPEGDRKIAQREQVIRKKISKVENDIALWRNNLEFFAASENADRYRDEFNGKIEDASQHLLQLKQQLKLIRAAYQD